jgi:hypothetical protein
MEGKVVEGGGSVSHEYEKGAGSPLGLVGVLASSLGLPAPGGGLLGALALHRQPATNERVKKNGILGTAQEQIWIEGKSSSLGIGPGGALGFGSLHDG